MCIHNEAAAGVDAANCAAQSLPPGADQRCERVAASEIADRGRRPGARRLLARLEERPRVVGLEGAERRDAGQEDALLATRGEQSLSQRRGGALRRHVDRCVGKR